MIWVLTRDPEVFEIWFAFLNLPAYLPEDCHLTLLVIFHHVLFLADQTVDFNQKLIASRNGIEMILDHHHTKLREDQIALLPELVRYGSFLVHLVHIDELVAPIENLGEIE